ncbi:unnamed protein product, partial [Coregonus sp. 'balchen']
MEHLQCSVVSTKSVPKQIDFLVLSITLSNSSLLTDAGDIVNKHAPIKKMRIKNRFSPWFDRDLAELLHLKNSIWRKAQHTLTHADWLSFK